MNYVIPNDDGKKFRKKVFLSLLDSSDLGYVDGATDYCLLLPFAEDYMLNTKDRLWLAFLYGMSYSCTTSIRFFTNFPNPDKILPNELKKFWKAEKRFLWFNPDKKYLKNNDQVIPAIHSIYKNSRGDFETYMVENLKKGFDHMYKVIKRDWKFFGPHGAYLFFDAVYGLCPELYSDPTNLDWKNCGKTVSEGMAHLLYLDDCIETKEHDFDRYNKNVNILVEKSGQPKVIIESTLCAFRKMFKQTRYHGYYADRMLEECNEVEKLMDSLGFDVWDYRKRTIPEVLRGEVNGWSGIRTEKCKLFLEKGKIDE